MRLNCSSVVRLVASVLLAGATSACAASHVSQAPAMTLGAATTAPLGFLELCERAPQECTSQGAAGAAMSGAEADAIRWLARSQFWAAAFQAAPAAPSSLRSHPDDGRTDWTAAAAAGAADTTADEGGLALTPDLRRTLETVNTRVNGAILQRSDRSVYGVDDYWATPLGSSRRPAGDCEDYVLEKRRALVAAGVPATALSIAIVRTAWNEVHAVLLVGTDKGELVLDNLNPRVGFWVESRYRWVERQVAGAPLQWVSVAVVR